MASPELTAPARPRLAVALRAWVGVYFALWGFTLATALLLWLVPGGAPFARSALSLALSGDRNPPPSVPLVLAIARNNLLHSAWPLTLGLLELQRRRSTRLLGDVAVFANLLLAALLVGGAIGGYGVRALPFLPHLPLEWTGITVGASGWVVDRRRALDRRARLLGLALAVILLGLAAIFESCLVPHR